MYAADKYDYKSFRTKDDTTVPLEDSARFSKHENGSLEIRSTERGDLGQYACFATNTEGKSAITASLDIKGILSLQVCVYSAVQKYWAPYILFFI